MLLVAAEAAEDQWWHAQHPHEAKPAFPKELRCVQQSGKVIVVDT